MGHNKLIPLKNFSDKIRIDIEKLAAAVLARADDPQRNIVLDSELLSIHLEDRQEDIVEEGEASPTEGDGTLPTPPTLFLQTWTDVEPKPVKPFRKSKKQSKFAQGSAFL